MSSVSPLLTLIEAYSAATGLADATISTKIFNDGKKIAVLHAKGTITAKRMDEAIRWFSNNWPGTAVWPSDIPRPAQPDEAA